MEHCLDEGIVYENRGNLPCSAAPGTSRRARRPSWRSAPRSSRTIEWNGLFLYAVSLFSHTQKQVFSLVRLFFSQNSEENDCTLLACINKRGTAHRGIASDACRERNDVKMTNSRQKQMIAFLGIVIVNFMTMFLVASVGTFGYTVAGYLTACLRWYDSLSLESVARCVAIPISGKLSDRVGHRSSSSPPCGIHRCFRCGRLCPRLLGIHHRPTVTGFAWGLFVSNIFVLISDLFGQDEAPRYSGIARPCPPGHDRGSPSPVSCARSTGDSFFYASLPVLVVGLVLCAIGIPDIPKRTGGEQRYRRGRLYRHLCGSHPLLPGHELGQQLRLGLSLLLTLIAVAVVGLIILILAERKAQNPLYPAKLLGNKYYLSIFMVSLFYSLGNAANNYVPTYVQSVLGYGSTVAGFVTLPAPDHRHHPLGGVRQHRRQGRPV